MAIFVLKGVQIWIGQVNLSDHLKGIEVTVETANNDATAMQTSAIAWQANMPGITSWQVTADLQQDEAFGKTGETLWACLGILTTVEVRPVTGNRSTTNPGYNGNCMLKSYPILAGGAGDVAMSKVTLIGSGALARSTS